MNEKTGRTNESEQTARKPGWISVALSVVAAAFGVQSSKNRERDFASGSYLPYIIGGIVFTALFVAAVIAVVSFVLGNSS